MSSRARSDTAGRKVDLAAFTRRTTRDSPGLFLLIFLSNIIYFGAQLLPGLIEKCNRQSDSAGV